MFLFCIFWTPLFYLFRRSLAGEGGVGGVWALILGSLTAIFQFFLGDLVEGGGFGLSRWMSAFIDIIGLPVLIPLIVYLVFIVFRLFSGNYDFANFMLLWLIPVAGIKALGWSSLRSPLLLIIVPLLWTALAAGVSMFINCIIRYFRWYVAVFSGIGIVALFGAAITSYWAIFSQHYQLGYSLFSAVMLTMVIAVILDYVQSR